MESKKAQRETVPLCLEAHGGLRPGTVDRVHHETGVPAADIYGVATFYHLLAEPDAGARVCQGLSCRLAGSQDHLAKLTASGATALPASCLGRCDFAPAVWDAASPETLPATAFSPSSSSHAIDLLAAEFDDYAALEKVRQKPPEWLLDELETSELTGRGGAGFPAHIKWRAIARQTERERYVVLNADEGEPGTFKDREVILRRPHLVVEGLAIAAHTLGAGDIYCYVRGEFGMVKAALERAVSLARTRGWVEEELRWHFVDGHGAYICGEETALLEALEGKRGLPRMKPPYPGEKGFRQKPTLIQNVETIACLPAIVRKGGAWFKSTGATEAGSKLYCLSGHVERPGVYEAPMGTTLSELLEGAGGVVGTLKAFSPGGASSGFLPADRIDVPLDFRSLQEAGSMLGSAGIVLLNETVDMAEAARIQAGFFEDESCGQCAPCRIGTQMVRQALDRFVETRDPEALAHLEEVAWGMKEASICGLGQAAPLPLESAMHYFGEDFQPRP